MKIQTIEFFAFSILIISLYHFLPRKRQNHLLLLASFVFYFTICWYFPLILLVMSLGNFGLAKIIDGSGRAKRWLWFGISFNLIIWQVIRSAGFFTDQLITFLKWLGLNFNFQGLKILLPIGLSFYVLQAISYLVDVYRHEIRASQSLSNFTLYLIYFPKLTAGPIERAKSFLAKLENKRAVNPELISKSFSLIILGLLRKVVIGDTLLDMVPGKLLQAPGELPVLTLVAGSLALAFGVYNDFCGYTNIVRGVSGFFGIELTRNFRFPFFAKTFMEFWNRWHISLSHWLRDYIYFPLSRAIVRRYPRVTNPANIIIPPLATMMASGFWHGSEINWLLWGGLTGVYLMIERIISIRQIKIFPEGLVKTRHFLASIKVTVMLLFSLIIFRLDVGISVTDVYWAGINITGDPVGFLALALVALSIFIDFKQSQRQEETFFLTWAKWAQALTLALTIILIVLFSLSQVPNPFIYQGF